MNWQKTALHAWHCVGRYVACHGLGRAGSSNAKGTPPNRMGSPEDVANLDLFLASDETSYISGEVIRIDGGMVVGT